MTVLVTDLVRDDKQPSIKRTVGAKGSEGKKGEGNKSKGRPRTRVKKTSPKKPEDQLPPGPAPAAPAPSEDETKRPRQVKTPANPIASSTSSSSLLSSLDLDDMKAPVLIL